MIAYELVLKGRVQGVGMRYSVHQKANELGLFGTVKNLSNGHVKLFVQGSKKAVNDLKSYLNNYASGNIEHIEETKVKPNVTMKSFEITF